MRIERASNGGVVLTLSGEVKAEDVAELKRLVDLEENGRHLVLDLRNVTLVDRGAIEFLGHCAETGIALENCPGYVREWIAQENERRRG